MCHYLYFVNSPFLNYEYRAVDKKLFFFQPKAVDIYILYLYIYIYFFFLFLTENTL